MPVALAGDGTDIERSQLRSFAAAWPNDRVADIAAVRCMRAELLTRYSITNVDGGERMDADAAMQSHHLAEAVIPLKGQRGWTAALPRGATSPERTSPPAWMLQTQPTVIG